MTDPREVYDRVIAVESTREVAAARLNQRVEQGDLSIRKYDEHVADLNQCRAADLLDVLSALGNCLEKIEKIKALFDSDTLLWSDLAPRLSCLEAERLADALQAFSYDDAAEQMLMAHSTSDEPGDDHKPICDDAGIVQGWTYQEQEDQT